MEAKSLKKNAVLNVIKTICGIAFPLITFPYASRILLAEGTGKVNFANSIIAYFKIISTLGIGTYAVRGASAVRDNRRELSKFVKEILAINLISTFIAYICFLGAMIFVQKFQNLQLLLCICSSSILLETVGINWLYSALEEYKYITVRSLSFQALSLILLFTLVKTTDDYIKYAAISVISAAGSNILNLFHSRLYINLFEKVKLELKKHIKPILILFVTAIAINIFTILDTSMLGCLTNTTEVGYYSAASKIVKMIRDVFPAVFTVLFARLSYYVAHKDKKSLTELSEKTLTLIFFLAPPMVVGLVILMPSIVHILCGSNFEPSINTARIMSPLLIISSYSGFLGGQILVAMKREKTYMWCMIAAALCDVVLNLFFIPLWGAFGAAAATLATELFIFILYTTLLRNFLATISLKKNLIHFLLATAVMGIVIFFEHKYLQTDFFKIIIIPLSGGVIYVLVLLALKNQFLASMVNTIRKKLQHKRNN